MGRGRNDGKKGQTSIAPHPQGFGLAFRGRTGSGKTGRQGADKLEGDQDACRSDLRRAAVRPTRAIVQRSAPYQWVEAETACSKTGGSAADAQRAA